MSETHPAVDLLGALRASLSEARIAMNRAAPLITEVPDEKREPVYGMCSACRSVEVKLNRVDRYTAIDGESDRYPVGYGCEVCD